MNVHKPTFDTSMVLQDIEIIAGNLKILDRITLTISAGLPTILIGPNGSGKTTLLRTLMGLIRPSSGRISWDGHKRSANARRAIVFQRPVMLRRTTSANLRYALAAAGVPRTKRASRVAELLALVGLQGLGERSARRLSGGEQQRLAIARALAREPSTLFLDEPTASLDPYAIKAIEDLVRTVSAKGIKVVMSTHDLGQAKRLGDDIVLLHRGRVIEHTRAKEFFANPRTEDARKFIAGELLV